MAASHDTLTALMQSIGAHTLIGALARALAYVQGALPHLRACWHAAPPLSPLPQRRALLLGRA